MKAQLMIWSLEKPKRNSERDTLQQAGAAEEGCGGESKEQVRTRQAGKGNGGTVPPQHTKIHAGMTQIQQRTMGTRMRRNKATESLQCQAMKFGLYLPDSQ